MNVFFSTLYGAGYWIRREVALCLAELVKIFLLSYSTCAVLCKQRRSNRFALVPKLHMLDHVGKRLHDDAGKAGWCRNPIAESVQIQEDYIGKPSRVSRRVSSRKIHERVLKRALLATHLTLLGLLDG